MPKRTLFRTKWALIVLVAALCFGALLVVRGARKPKGFAANLAPDTCYCYSGDRPLNVHVDKDGVPRFMGERVSVEQLRTQLRNVYGLRFERVVFLSADKATEFQSVADVIDVVRNVPELDDPLTPAALKTNRPMDIKVMLVTDTAVRRACNSGCFNWFTQPNTPFCKIPL